MSMEKKLNSTTAHNYLYSNKEGDSVSPSGYRAAVMTAASRTAQSPVITTPSTRRHGRPHLQPPRTTSKPLTTTPLKRPHMGLSSTPNPRALTTMWPPYLSQKPTVSPLRPPISTTLTKTQEEKLRLGEKLENTDAGNQVYKRPRGRGRGHGHRRGRLRGGSVRLVSSDGLSHRGRLEIFIRGEWGTVCDDLFTTKAGTVVCRQLGYKTALAVLKRAALGEAHSSVRILLDDVECEGGERSLLECKRSKVGKHNCTHGEDVGVICG